MRGRIGLLLLLLIAVSMSGCTKCGWIWQQGARACHAEVPK